jgi:type I restriction enzyme S subunit
LLEELEISEVNYWNVVKSSSDFRFHSEYFKKEFMNNVAMKNKATLKLGSIASIADGDHAKFPDNQNPDIRYLQARDISNNFLELKSDSFVSETYFLKNKRSLVNAESILFSIMGTVGDITITPKDFVPCMCNRALAIIRDIQVLLPQYVFSYLSGKYGMLEIERLKNGGVQQRVNLDVLGMMNIPVFSQAFQAKIVDFVITSQSVRKQSKQAYAEAEAVLLDELGLADFTPSTEAVSIKGFAESFGSTGRLDAEYYQPKYDDYLKLIKNYRGGYEKIEDAFISVKTSSNFQYPAYKYIEIGDINIGDGSCSYTERVLEELPDNAKIVASKGDLLISKVRPNRGAISIVPYEFDNLIVSGAFTVLRQASKRNLEVLKTLLRTSIYKSWLLQSNVGTSYPVIRDEDVLNVLIPKIPFEIESVIQNKIQNSFTLKTESERLLAIAKRGVELAIESDEASAQAWMQSEVEKLGTPTIEATMPMKESTP